MATMKAAVFRRYGPLSNLQMETVPRPTPEPNQVQVQIHAAGLNDYEFGLIYGAPFIIRFFLGLSKPKIMIPGCDMSGKVVAVGSDVTRWKVGDEVYGDLSGGRFGALAEYVCCSEELLVAKHKELDFLEAAAMPMALQLAVQGLAAGGKLRADQEVLINGAGGGVGFFGAQLALAKGVKLSGVDLGEKSDHLQQLGYSETVDYKKETFHRRGKRYDLILDTKTSYSPFAYYRALKPGGTYATVGGSMLWFILGQLLSAPMRWLTGKRYVVIVLKPNGDLEQCNELVAAGKLKSQAHHVYPIEQFRQGLELLESGKQLGKIVLRMPVLDEDPV